MPRLGFGVSDDFSTRRTSGRKSMNLDAHPGMIRERIDRNASRICLSIAGSAKRDSTAERACAYAGYYTMVFAALCTFAPASTANAMEQVARLLPIQVSEPAMNSGEQSRTGTHLLRGTLGTQESGALGDWGVTGGGTGG